MTNRPVSGDTDLLREMCAEHDLPHQLLVELLKIEREHQFQARRHGIMEELGDSIKSSLRWDE